MKCSFSIKVVEKQGGLQSALFSSDLRLPTWEQPHRDEIQGCLFSPTRPPLEIAQLFSARGQTTKIG